ncbi:RNA-directed DNA polymerase from mobile element jockey [Araneus ventricosus]|uniref:RNA-directed DNA polymerase from mobile element jockey n=1 Tax=Araneus ventricosus TaxID=182803 RepID=A0A4Y2I9Y7_ARAVE|nr:RNA-directed DNA polymerase from mobile element jockey [Araneus ventricosus]
MISKLSEKVQNEGLVNELRNLNADDGTIWKYVKPFKKKFKNIPNLISPAGIGNTDQEKANFLADSLEKQFTLNNVSDPDTEEIVSDSVTCFRINNNYPSELNDPPFPPEIVKCIKKLKINKAPGIDSINNKILKNLPWNIILNLNTIIHKIMTIGHFPSRWKTATVVPILKPGKDPTDTSSYRPISLLPSISKIADPH